MPNLRMCFSPWQNTLYWLESLLIPPLILVFSYLKKKGNGNLGFIVMVWHIIAFDSILQSKNQVVFKQKDFSFKWMFLYKAFQGQVADRDWAHQSCQLPPTHTNARQTLFLHCSVNNKWPLCDLGKTLQPQTCCLSVHGTAHSYSLSAVCFLLPLEYLRSCSICPRCPPGQHTLLLSYFSFILHIKLKLRFVTGRRIRFLCRVLVQTEWSSCVVP